MSASPKELPDAAAAAAALGPWAGSTWTASHVPVPAAGMHPFHRWRALLYGALNDGSTRAGRLVIGLLTVGILLSVIVFCLQTLPQYRLAALQGLEPEGARVFDVIEAVVMISFTVDYAIRLLTVTAVPTLSEQRHYAALAAQGKTAPLCEGCSFTCSARRRSRRASSALSEPGGGSVRGGGEASAHGGDGDDGRATPGAPPVLPLSVHDAARPPVLSAGSRGLPTPPHWATLVPAAGAQRDVTDAPPHSSAPAAAPATPGGGAGGEIELTDLRPAGVPLPARGSPPASASASAGSSSGGSGSGKKKAVTIVDADGSVHGTAELDASGGGGSGSRPWVDTSAAAMASPAAIAHADSGGHQHQHHRGASPPAPHHDSHHHGSGSIQLHHADSTADDDDSPGVFGSSRAAGSTAVTASLGPPSPSAQAASAPRSSSLTRLIAAVEAAGARGELPPLPPPPPPYFGDIEGYYASALAVGLAHSNQPQQPGGFPLGKDGLPLSVSVAAARMAALSTTTGRLVAAGHDYVASVSSRADVVDCCCGCPLPPAAPLPLRKLFTFVTSPLNVIDIIAITPFYVSLSNDARNSVALQVVRVLRIGRVLTLLKLTRHHSGLMVLSATMRASTHMLLFLLFFVTLAVVFYGALMFYCEAGEYDALTGEWMRINQLHNGVEPTPFTSIPVSMYWAVVTLTTVGYGDMYPTTDWGRFLACCAMLTGALVLALPVTVLSGNFQEQYGEYNRRRSAHHRLVATWKRQVKAHAEAVKRAREEAEAKAARAAARAARQARRSSRSRSPASSAAHLSGVPHPYHHHHHGGGGGDDDALSPATVSRVRSQWSKLLNAKALALMSSPGSAGSVGGGGGSANTSGGAPVHRPLSSLVSPAMRRLRAAERAGGGGAPQHHAVAPAVSSSSTSMGSGSGSVGGSASGTVSVPVPGSSDGTLAPLPGDGAGVPPSAAPVDAGADHERLPVESGFISTAAATGSSAARAPVISTGAIVGLAAGGSDESEGEGEQLHAQEAAGVPGGGAANSGSPLMAPVSTPGPAPAAAAAAPAAGVVPPQLSAAEATAAAAASIAGAQQQPSQPQPQVPHPHALGIVQALQVQAVLLGQLTAQMEALTRQVHTSSSTSSTGNNASGGGAGNGGGHSGGGGPGGSRRGHRRDDDSLRDD